MVDRSNTIRICRKAIIVALIVGTVLNLINQGDALFGARDVNIVKFVLTYLVPFFVSAHGAFLGMTGAVASRSPAPESAAGDKIQ